MKESTSREKILKRVRKALIQKSNLDFVDLDFETSVFTASEEPLEVLFAQKFSALNGKFIFCENENEFIRNLPLLVKENAWTNIYCFEKTIKELLNRSQVPFSADEGNMLQADIGITGCEYVIARTGSICISSKQMSGRRLPIYANVHIVVAYTSQLVLHIKDALKGIKAKYKDQPPSLTTCISGPSRTADIEKTLVQGAHGPKDIFVFLIDDAPSSNGEKP